MKLFILLVLAISLGIRLNGSMPRLYTIQPLQGTTVALAPTPTSLSKSEIINKSKHPKMIADIWNLESSKGKDKNPMALHNLCKSQGKSNEFGYGGMKLKLCYPTFQEAVNVVDNWLTERDKESACYYNLGIRTTKCSYVEHMDLSYSSR